MELLLQLGQELAGFISGEEQLAAARRAHMKNEDDKKRISFTPLFQLITGCTVQMRIL